MIVQRFLRRQCDDDTIEQQITNFTRVTASTRDVVTLRRNQCSNYVITTCFNLFYC